MNETPELLPIIVIRLTEPAPEGNDLRELAKRAGYRGLAALLEAHREIEAARAIQSVDPKELLAIERRARDSDYPPLHSLTSFWRLDCTAIPDAVDELIEVLNKLEGIGLAYQESDTTEPAAVTNPTQNPRYANEQGYLTDAPNGIGVTHAWDHVDGSGVGFADVERCWYRDHEDLVGLAPIVLSGNNTALATSARHGAAVLGIVAGRNNNLGIIGIAPGVTGPRLSTQYINLAVNPNVAGAVLKTVVGPNALVPGDVLLVEVQLTNFQPPESENLTFTAIRIASALGIVVVETAGNGSLNLNTTLPLLDPFSPSFQDSGAILVGAGSRTAANGLGGGTNFGRRIDCYAWGDGITTVAGNGNLTPGAAEEQRYTSSFDGTSAAAAIVAGAALLVQDLYQQGTPTRPAGERLSPRRMRELLETPANSTAPPAGASIGRMPNLEQLLTVVSDVPDLYIRDFPGDAGVVPSVGLLSISPDVVASNTSLSGAALAAAFSAGTSEVELGQDNFVYVRVSNRNAVEAVDAKVRVFWSEVDTLITPDDWKPLNPIVPPQAHATLTVPASGWLVQAPEIVWQEPNLPAASGHYCFVATVDHPLDPEPYTAAFDLDPLLAWDVFLAFIRNNNNVTWRNFNAVDLIPNAGGGAGGATPVPFLISGAPDTERAFDLEILQSCPEAVSVVWELPRTLFRQLHADFAEVREPKGCRLWAALWPRRYGRVSAVLQPRAELVLPGVLLEKSAQHQCRFVFAGTERLPDELCTVAIRQLYDGIEVGRVTWELRAGRE